MLVMCEFINALLRVADETFGESSLTTLLLTTHYPLPTTHPPHPHPHPPARPHHSPPPPPLPPPGESSLTLVQRAEELLERFIVPYAQAVLQPG